MRFLALVVVLAGLARAKECPPGFNDDGSGSCLSQRYGTASRNAAYKDCSRNNSYLYEIQNAFVNHNIQELAGSSPEVWLGLTCTSNSVSSCVWDSGRALTNKDFSNFYGGAPNADAGACVLMLVANGMWYSVPCTKSAANYGCQYLGEAKVPDCMGDAMYFRGSCYYVPPTTVDRHYDGQVACWNTCGEYASIHSAGENSVVRDLVSVNNGATYTYIGLNSYGSNGNYYWDDSSFYNFSQFGYENVHLGYCVAMAIVDGEVVGNGKWISAQCESSEYMKIVCKKDPVNACDVEPTTTLAPTLAPLQCVSPYFYSGEGYMYSPGYPRGSEANLCEYMITEDSGQAYITFYDLSLDRNSYISLYSSIFDKTPFITLSNIHSVYRQYSSPTNMLKVVYNTSGNTQGNYFKAFYSGSSFHFTTESPYEATTAVYDQCGGYFDHSTTIQSPVGNNLNCQYSLSTGFSTAPCIIFDVLNLTANMTLTIADNASPRSARVNNSDVGKTFCSYGYYGGLLTFQAPVVNSYDPPAFVARYVDDFLNKTCNGGDFYYSGTITSPNYPLPYTPNMNCVYTLYSNRERIVIDFTDFYTETNYDYVRVLNGNSETEIDKITGGPYSNYTVTSTSNVVKVVFISDGSIQYRGFTANFYSV